jgi:hypothetical protein
MHRFQCAFLSQTSQQDYGDDNTFHIGEAALAHELETSVMLAIVAGR